MCKGTYLAAVILFPKLQPRKFASSRPEEKTC